MGMPINGLALALIDSAIFSEADITQLIQRAHNAQLGLARFLYEHQQLTATEILNVSQRYYDLPIIEPHAIHSPRFDGDVIYFSQDDGPCAAIIDPNDLVRIQPTHRVCLLSIPDFFELQSTKEDNASHTQHTIIEHLNQLLWNAFRVDASDIHIEPAGTDFQVRQRLHGELQHQTNLDSETGTRILMRLKVLAEMDVAQQHLAQDGRFTFQYQHHQCDCRLNICPTIDGEKAVIRLLNPQQKLRTLDEIGFHPTQRQFVNDALARTQGLILVTGPTGAGKTQTLYSLIHHLRDQYTNISTIEDPVEIKLAGINQFSINERRGLTTTHILRALLRQDPDVIMIGEIRDTDTATLAIRAAQTGHLVLATLHTQDCIESIFRLRHLGISAHELASAISLIINQRLVRCSRAYTQPRHGVFEVLNVDTTLRTMIESQAARHDIEADLTSKHFMYLWQHGQYLLGNGILDKTHANTITQRASDVVD